MIFDGGKSGMAPAKTALTVVGLVLSSAGIWYVLEVILDAYFSQFVTNSLSSVTLLLVAFATTRVIGHALVLFEEQTWLTPHQTEASYRFAQLFVYGAFLIGVVYVWNIGVTNVLLGAGLTSVILALAARQTLSSVFAGINLISTDVFRVGDWVRIDNRFGQIDQISLFNTMVRSPQGETHVFPNDEIIARDITNLGKNKYRNDVLVGVAYGTDIDHAVEVCDEVLEDLIEEEANNIDGYHPTTVKDFDESQITLAVKMWIEEPKPMTINKAQTTVLSSLKNRFDEEEIKIPFPQREVSGEMFSDRS